MMLPKIRRSAFQDLRIIFSLAKHMVAKLTPHVPAKEPAEPIKVPG
jgi:hypothetical protein